MTATSESALAVGGAPRGQARWLMLIVLLAGQFMALLDATVTLLMVTYGGFLFSLAIHLQAGLGDSALRAGLTCAPCAAAFGLCGYFWRRLPAAWHPYLVPAGAAVGACGYAALGALLRDGGPGGLWLQPVLVLAGGSLAVAFSPLVTQSLVRVPLDQAADASGLLTTALQLSQAIGVAVFGSLYLTLGAGQPGRGPQASGHALFITLAWVAVTLACGVAAAMPLARVVRTAALARPPG
jgi:hypothetical protein